MQIPYPCINTILLLQCYRAPLPLIEKLASDLSPPPCLLHIEPIRIRALWQPLELLRPLCFFTCAQVFFQSWFKLWSASVQLPRDLRLCIGDCSTLQPSAIWSIICLLMSLLHSSELLFSMSSRYYLYIYSQVSLFLIIESFLLSFCHLVSSSFNLQCTCKFLVFQDSYALVD